MYIFHTHTKSFGTIHYQLRHPSQFQKPSQKKLRIVAVRIMRNNKYLIRKWSALPEIINKLAYAVLPKHVVTLAALFTIDIHIRNSFTL
jgi:hypothetical protein